MTAEKFRELALALDGAEERAHMGHPDFRANGRIFASLHTGDRTAMVKLTPEEQQEFLSSSPQMFEPSPGAWGRQGCTNVLLRAADVKTVTSALLLAYEGVMRARPRKR